MITSFQETLRSQALRNQRSLNVFSAIVVTILGFLFEFAYHDGYILISGLLVSMLMTSNYFLSYYNDFYRDKLRQITELSVFILHFWALFVAYQRNFEIDVLLPVAISTFTFSLVFDKFFRSLIFLFTITTVLLILMLTTNHWRPEYTITLVSLYAGAFLSDQILKRKKQYHGILEKQEERYISLVENMNDGLVYIDNDRTVQFVNDTFCQISGYTREQVIGKDLIEFAPEAQLDSPNSFYRRLREGNNVRVESELSKWSGQVIRVQKSGAPYFGEGRKRMGSMVVFTDISGLYDAREQLKKSEEGYRTFIEQSAVGIWRAEYRQPIPVDLPIDQQVELLLDTGIIVECNDFMARMYGHSDRADLIGRRIRDFYYIENNLDEQKTRELMSAYIQNNYRVSNAESKELDKHGSIRYMLNNNIGIVENGHLMRTWGVQTDITDRKRTERELLETNQELDTFFYKASHDLKGPLASVMGIVNLARIESRDQIMSNYFDMIETSIKRLDQTLLDLIELARTRKGASKLSSIRVHDLVGEILHSLRHLPHYSRINFELKIDDQLEIISDKVLVLSVFQNLIHNAINYCNPDSPWIRIRVDGNPNGINIEITDNGKGIPEKIQGRVFEMFYRGNPDSSGSGLGLFIVKNALEKLKGKIRFISAPGRGTSFYVEIPSALSES